MKKQKSTDIYYAFTQNSRMNFSTVPYGKCIDSIVFGIYVKNDGCISEAAMIWEKCGDEIMSYIRMFCDGIKAVFSEKFKTIANEIDEKESITPPQFAELLIKHGFEDESDK